MAILLRFGPEDLLRCRFAMSPLWEMTAAIRTLAEPDRQVHHLPWLRQAAGRSGCDRCGSGAVAHQLERRSGDQ